MVHWLLAKLEAQGIKMVAGLVTADPKALRLCYGVVVQRIVPELRGIPCTELGQEAQVKQQIICSRSFGEHITQIGLMRQALAGYRERAAETRRGDVLSARDSVHPHQPVQRPGTLLRQPSEHQAGNPTHGPRGVFSIMPELLPRIWRDELRYQKGGVMLADFTPATMLQGDLFAANQQSPRSEALMQVIDKINQARLGKVYFSACGRDNRGGGA